LAEYEVRFPGLPRRHLLGSGPELSEQVVMLISLAEPAGPGAPARSLPEIPSPRYYWRSVTYDRYNGRGWQTGRTATMDYAAGQPIIALDALARSPETRYARMVGQQVHVERDAGGLLYLAGTLVTVDQDYQVAWRSQPAEENLARGDALGASLERSAYPAVYRVDSLVTVASEAQLRAAGSGYPAWVQDRYLALPEGLPGRVLSKARDLTATEPTPYDRARAIEAYLRTFPYTLDLPGPPTGRDVVDYFLFDLQQGYCDYYATSMVVLARAAGLPARLVVGYASGTYDAARGVYVVTEADAHSWPEIYFPGYGWVEFEPTAGRPPIERPTESPFTEPPDFIALGPKLVPRIQISPLWCLSPAVSLVVLGLGAVVWSALERQRLRRLSPQAAVGILYGRLYRHGQRLAVPVRPGDTPYEFLASLAQRINDIARESRWSAMLEPAAREASRVTHLYVRTCYSPYDPDPADQRQAIHAWSRLNGLLWLAWLCQAGGFVCRLSAIFSHPARRAERQPTGLEPGR
jgi:transglutaminase-like putative cysteine protease